MQNDLCFFNNDFFKGLLGVILTKFIKTSKASNIASFKSLFADF